MQKPEIRLDIIAQKAAENLEENMQFRDRLKAINGTKLDKRVFEVQAEISAQIDCLACGNCCKTFMITVTNADAKRAAVFLNTSTENFCSQYTDKGMEGQIFNKIPCHFLCSDNKCSIYAARPTDCSSFPHLDKPGFQQRLLSAIDNYGVCPIVYSVFEELKKEFQFI